MTVLTEARRPGEFILSEAAGQRSRAAVTIAADQTIEPNTVLARKAIAAGVTVAQSFEGTGSGVLTLAEPAVSSKVKDGVYTVTCIEPATGGGVFEVRDPAGKSLGRATVGVAFNKEVKFTIADGDPDFAAGDVFRLTVSADDVDYQWVAFDQDGTDGSEIAAGIAIHGVVTDVGETRQISAMVRDMEANGNCLVWPDDIEAEEKVDAEQALEALGIIVRY